MALEQQESFKKVEAPQGAMSNLSDYAMVRQNTQLNSDSKSNDTLVGSGALPALEIGEGVAMAAATKAPRPLPGNDIATPEQKKAGIEAKQEVNGNDKTTNARYPNGVEVSVSSGTTIHGDNGKEIVISDSSLITSKNPIHETKEGSGVFVDKDNKVVAKVMDDGSVVVAVSDTEFVRQTPEGLKKATVIRTPLPDRDFVVINTDTPLGDLRPSDMTQHDSAPKKHKH